jgi:uncharacterized Zn finger protein (UPF0148 family)
MEDLTMPLMEYRRLLATEVGTEPPCPWCGIPRVRRSDYIRCNPCGTNWLDSERHLRDYLNRNPSSARMVTTASKPAATSAEDANAS